MLIGVVHAGAQSTEPTELRARRATTSPKIDGILDDEVWSGDPLPLERWVSYNPLRGEPAPQRTSVWIAYDDRAVYFAFRCSDAEPEKIRTTIARRDNAWNDDWVAISLDSSRAGQVAYHMFVNPSGIQMDALNTGSNGEDSSPDWIWQSAGHIDEQGYTVEIRLPLESIRFRGGSDVRMGVMFFRLALNDHEAGQPIPIFPGSAALCFDWTRPVTPQVAVGAKSSPDGSGCW